MGDEEQTLSFIRSAFRSVWAIELLRFLVRESDAGHTSADLVKGLRASKAVISQSVAQLSAVALVVEDENGLIRFHPADPGLANVAEDAVALYERRPDQVRRAIVLQTSPGIAAFSDAFKLRRD